MRSQASPAGDCALFPRVRLPSAICARQWGLPVLWVRAAPPQRLPSGGACADIACPTVGPRTRARVPAAAARGSGTGSRASHAHPAPWGPFTPSQGPSVSASPADPAPLTCTGWALGLGASALSCAMLKLCLLAQGGTGDTQEWQPAQVRPGGLWGWKPEGPAEWADGRDGLLPLCQRLLWPLQLLWGRPLGGLCRAP